MTYLTGVYKEFNDVFDEKMYRDLSFHIISNTWYAEPRAAEAKVTWLWKEKFAIIDTVRDWVDCYCEAKLTVRELRPIDVLRENLRYRIWPLKMRTYTYCRLFEMTGVDNYIYCSERKIEKGDSIGIWKSFKNIWSRDRTQEEIDWDG
jgi:hypothetical protein